MQLVLFPKLVQPKVVVVIVVAVVHACVSMKYCQYRFINKKYVWPVYCIFSSSHVEKKFGLRPDYVVRQQTTFLDLKAPI